MKIVAPCSSVDEIEMLAHFGASEIYCGINPPEWEKYFSDYIWINRRHPKGGNFTSWQSLAEAIYLAHKFNIKVYVTLNAPYYPQNIINYLFKLIDRLVDINIDGIIVSDINFLLQLKQKDYPFKIHLSSVATCLNSKAANFFYKYCNVSRIILPRYLTISEIKQLVKNSLPELEFEVFVLNDGCYYEEGLCQTNHSFGPFCLTSWTLYNLEYKYNNLSNLEDSDLKDKEKLMEIIEKEKQNLKKYLWYQNNCGSSFQSEGFPNGPCSLCHLASFQKIGIKAIKIVGREASFFRKMRSIQLVKMVMDKVLAGIDEEKIKTYARMLRNTPKYCDEGYMCYYKER